MFTRILDLLSRFLKSDGPTSWVDLGVGRSRNYSRCISCSDVIGVMTEGLSNEEADAMEEIVKRLYRFKYCGGLGDLKEVETLLKLLQGVHWCEECGTGVNSTYLRGNLTGILE